MDSEREMSDRWYRTGVFEPAEVHQATGIVTVQLDVSCTEALALLRDYAAHSHRELIEVACDVLARQLQLPGPQGPA
jgi:hypothetical protein